MVELEQADISASSDLSKRPSARDSMKPVIGNQLMGVSAATWFNILRENRFSVDPAFFPRALIVSAASVLNSLCGRLENVAAGADLDESRSQPDPIFILGHWRSGTTLLHNLLVCNERFGAPNFAQVFFPHSFSTLARPLDAIIRRFMPDRRPFDNMRLDPELPQEDEFALCTLTGLSPYLAYTFPRNWRHYDRYLTFSGVPESEVRLWQLAFQRYVRKIGRVLGRQLILKSPPHTARLRWILEIFPNARFIHIHRNPYSVFQSTRYMLRIGAPMAQMQKFDFGSVEDVILKRYRAMYEAFFEQRGLIKEGRFCEISYQDLVKNPLTQLAEVYNYLGLPDFATVETQMRSNIATVENYRPNRYPNLPEDIAQRIAEEWQFCFQAWGYSSDPANLNRIHPVSVHPHQQT